MKRNSLKLLSFALALCLMAPFVSSSTWAYHLTIQQQTTGTGADKEKVFSYYVPMTICCSSCNFQTHDAGEFDVHSQKTFHGGSNYTPTAQGMVELKDGESKKFLTSNSNGAGGNTYWYISVQDPEVDEAGNRYEVTYRIGNGPELPLITQPEQYGDTANSFTSDGDRERYLKTLANSRAGYYDEQGKEYPHVIVQGLKAPTTITFIRRLVNGVFPFTDVAEDAFYREAVLWAVDKKVTTGVTETTFDPNAPCTHVQIIAFLWRAAGQPEAKKGNVRIYGALDRKDWYYDAVWWAASMGMVEDTACLNQPCTRAEAVQYIYLAQQGQVGTPTHFVDVPQDAAYLDALNYCVAAGIVTGTGPDTFSPDMVCNRGQIVTLLHRAYVK